jgi:hypothetical protein
MNRRSGIALRDLLVVEDDPALLAFRCTSTGLPLWPQIRVVFFRMIMSDLLYGTALTGGSTAAVSPARAMATLGRSVLHNFASNVSGVSRAEICITVDGISGQWVDGKWFNRLADHFALQRPRQTLVMEDHFEWRWPFPRHHPRVLFHAPLQAGNVVRGKLRVRAFHHEQARELVALLAARAKRCLDWESGPQRERALIDMLARKHASLPGQLRAYDALLARIQPRLLMVGMGCYGPAASLIAAARRRGIITAEYQHGANAGGHDGYNFAATLVQSDAYRETLPQYFLSYGDWWNTQINAPLEKVSIGNPHRESKLGAAVAGRKSDVLILSDGTDFALYLELALALVPSLTQRKLRTVLRPHPLERTAVQTAYGTGVDGVAIDTNPDFYASLRSAHAVVSEVSTGIFEAVGIVDRLFIWDTPKARFTYPTQPLQGFRDPAELVELLARESAGRLTEGEAQAIWASPWKERYGSFLQRTLGAAA